MLKKFSTTGGAMTTKCDLQVKVFADGADLQLIVVPRPARAGAQPSSDASSIALHLHASLLGHEVTGLLARDHGDVVAGTGLNGSLGGWT